MTASTEISNDDNKPSLDTMSSEQYRSEKHSEGVFKRLSGREDLHDIILIAGEGGKRISAHCLILIGCSDYFSTLFTGSMPEKSAGKALTEVTLDDVDGNTLQSLITFFYTGNLEIREDSAKNLLSAAVLLKLNEIVEACCGFLQRHLKPSNCLSIAFTAEERNIEGLLQNARKFIYDNFVEVYKQQEFVLLSSVQLSQLLANRELNAPSEEDFMYAAIKWIEHDPEKRKNNLTELLSLIRLHLIKPEILLQTTLPLCCTIESKDLILQALKAQLSTESPTQKRDK